jgi:hypothetical protein
MSTKENAGYALPRPVRVMDPDWMYKFINEKDLNEKKARLIAETLSRYNQKVNELNDAFASEMEKIHGM